eukprot:1211304-Rhodomonas_salina.2
MLRCDGMMLFESGPAGCAMAAWYWRWRMCYGTGVGCSDAGGSTVLTLAYVLRQIPHAHRKLAAALCFNLAVSHAQVTARPRNQNAFLRCPGTGGTDSALSCL